MKKIKNKDEKINKKMIPAQMAPIQIQSHNDAHYQRSVPQYYTSQLDPNSIQMRGRSNSHNTAINTPLPPSPSASPIGSPSGSSIGSPLSDFDEDYMEGTESIKPEHWGY